MVWDVWTSKILMVLSSEAEQMWEEEEENAKSETPRVWPVNVWIWVWWIGE